MPARAQQRAAGDFRVRLLETRPNISFEVTIEAESMQRHTASRTIRCEKLRDLQHNADLLGGSRMADRRPLDINTAMFRIITIRRDSRTGERLASADEEILGKPTHVIAIELDELDQIRVRIAHPSSCSRLTPRTSVIKRRAHGVSAHDPPAPSHKSGPREVLAAQGRSSRTPVLLPIPRA